VLVALVAAANALAYRHAYAFTHYAPAGGPPPRPESLSVGDKLRLALSGVPVPRPANSSTPAAVGVAFTTHAVPVADTALEAWHVEHPNAVGTAVLGPGYMAAKSALLAEAREFHALGYAVLLVDFRGAGGSPGADTTLGVREGEDFAAAARYAERTWPGRPVVLYGHSMGAVAALKAVAAHGVTPAGLVLDAPFDRMTTAVRVRLRAMGVPAWPAAELVVFWGGAQVGIDGFGHNPADDAAAVRCPAVMLHGDRDRRATPEMVRAVFDSLGGPKAITAFPAGHEPLARVDPGRWRAAVRAGLLRGE
jgi:alpha-beta hydrolase superfamily lysophospholipase